MSPAVTDAFIASDERMPGSQRLPSILRRSRGLRLVGARLTICAALLAATPRALGAPSDHPQATPGTREVREAIDRSTAWVEKHATSPDRDTLQNFAFDAETRYLVTTLHPDARTRQSVGHGLDRDLRLVQPAAPGGSVLLSYWAVLLRVMAHRGIPISRQVADLRAHVELPPLLDAGDPTTAYWTAALLASSGGAPDPETRFDAAWIARSARGRASTPLVPTLADSYRVFHEVVARTDLGSRPVRLSDAQRAFVGRAVPALLEFCLANHHVDATAELLVSSALLGLRDDPAFARGIRTLLDQQRPDGTFDDPSNAASTVDDQRHTVLTGLWALLLAHGRPAGSG